MEGDKKFLPLELGEVDVILGMQWLYSLGITRVDWSNLTMTFMHQNKKMIIRGDLSLIKTKVNLKNMMKSWDESDQGFSVECRALEGGVTMAEYYGVEVLTVEESISVVLNKFEDVFDWLERLPLRREIEHHIHLKKGTDHVNV